MKLLLFFLIPLGAFAQNTDSEIISSKFENADSLYIKLNYREYDGCLGLFIGRIDTQIKSGKFGFRHATNSEILESDYFVGVDVNIIDFFIEFETISKKDKPVCYGIAGDHCFAIKLSINGVETEFMYKLTEENNWNGLALLIEKLERLKKTNANNG